MEGDFQVVNKIAEEEKMDVPGEICRLCGDTVINYVPIFDDTSEIAEKISKCLPIKINRLDELPSNICQQCLYNLNISYQLLVKSIQVDSNFRANLEKSSLQILKQPEEQQFPILCQFCDKLFPDMKIFQRHLQNAHLIHLEKASQPQKESELVDENMYSSIEASSSILVEDSDPENLDETPNPEETNSQHETIQSQELALPISDYDPESKNMDETPDSQNIPEPTCEKSDQMIVEPIRFFPINSKNVIQVPPQVGALTNIKLIYLSPATVNSNLTLKILPGDSKILQQNSRIVPLSSAPILPQSANVKIPLIKKKFPAPTAAKASSKKTPKRNLSRGDDSPPEVASVNYVRCDICDVAMEEDEKLEEHCYVHEEKPSQCKLCRVMCNSLYELYMHKKADHGAFKRFPVKFACRLCGKFFSHGWQWEVHEESTCKQKFSPFTCKYCSVMFSTQLKLKRHLRKHKQEILDDPSAEIFKCVVCPKVFTDEEFYEKHRNVHDPECLEKFKCSLCDRSFRDRPRLREHQLSIHEGVKNYQCDICGKSFHRRSNMKAHRDLHFGYNCEYCNEHFEKLNALITHLREVHKAEPSPSLTARRPKKGNCFICRFCGRQLTTAQTLKDHEHIHTNEKPHVCDICGKTFRSYTARWNHSQRHQVGSFACEHCGKVFDYKLSLTKHLLTHLPVEQRKHQCEICGKKFLRGPHLKVHMRIHNAERPFTCDICSFSFTQKGDLKRHRARHDANAKNQKEPPKCLPQVDQEINITEMEFVKYDASIAQEIQVSANVF